jgi:hypothetical protein
MCDLHWCIITKGVETKCAWLTLEQNHKGLNNKVFTYKRYIIYFNFFYNARFTFHRQQRTFEGSCSQFKNKLQLLHLWSFHCLPKQPTSTQATFKFLIQVVFLGFIPIFKYMPLQLHGLSRTPINVDTHELYAFASRGKSIMHIWSKSNFGPKFCYYHPWCSQVLS